jgi:hypothetical protein
MPGDAVYCPACGAASGALRVEPVAGEVETSSADVALGAPRRRWQAPVIIAAVVALIAVAAVVGGGNDRPSASPTTSAAPATTAPATTAPGPSTTVAAPVTTTTTFSQFAAAPMPDAAGVVVYESTNDGDVLRIDLGTGVVQRRYPSIGTRVAGAWTVLGRKGGFAMAGGSYDDQSPIYGVLDDPASAAVPIGTWTAAENYGTLAPRATPAAEPDEVWVWNDVINGEPTTLKRIRVDGTLTAGPVSLSRFGTVLGEDGPGAVVLQGSTGFYRATVEGQDVHIERLWPRAPVAYSSGALLDLDCDPALQCHLAVVDRASGEVRPVPGDVINHVLPSYDSTLSPDGHYLAYVDYTGGLETKLKVEDLTTGAGVLADDIMPRNYDFLGASQSAEFTADGKWLVYFNISGGIRLWKVGSPDGPVTFAVPGVTNVNMISVAPG